MGHHSGYVDTVVQIGRPGKGPLRGHRFMSSGRVTSGTGPPLVLHGV